VNVLIASSEVTPFSKTGGLADVCGSLPLALAKLGQNPVVITPAYRSAKLSGQPLEPTNITFDIAIGSKHVHGSLLRSVLPGSRVPIYLVDQPGYYDRRELYREDGEDYKDNCERFVFFSRAVLESIEALGIQVDVVHCNDWQTGLIPAYIAAEYCLRPGYENLVSLLTIHNMAYQGRFWHWDMLLTGLDWKYFNWRQMEFYGNLNLLKTGIVFADAINTVSPRYAEEIQRPPFGNGLEGVLQQRRDDLYGITNGVDYEVWNPANDPHLPFQYSERNWREGKSACKAAVREEMGLPSADHIPLVGLIGRLADQKGWDLVARVMKRWVRDRDVQWVILGTGEPVYHKLLYGLAKDHPERLAVRLEFSDRLAHLIEAAADIFLMPSRFEPCGLNQLYSLKYGAVPLVHATGGLADTIQDATEENLSEGTANGFAFHTYDVAALEETLQRACAVYEHQPDVWGQLVYVGMRQDWSWIRSAQRYIDVYSSLRPRRSRP
jgi:starch synthase